MANKSKSQKTKSSKVTKIVPAAGYLLIKSDESEKKSAGGIYLPESVNVEKPQKGKIIAIGKDEVLENGTKRKPEVKVGDTVIYKKWGGNEVKLEDIEYLFVKFDDVLAIVVS